jgi:hypothetical protein
VINFVGALELMFGAQHDFFQIVHTPRCGLLEIVLEDAGLKVSEIIEVHIILGAVGLIAAGIPQGADREVLE